MKKFICIVLTSIAWSIAFSQSQPNVLIAYYTVDGYTKTLAEAVELKLGVASPEQIELVTDDHESKEYAEKIRAILNA